ncbi:MAG: hypothetical protein PVI86_03090 [Phycisphaerae bacterium]|jgi:Tol biopolymer transport system component
MAAVICVVLLTRTQPLFAGETVRVSVSTTGEEANRYSAAPSISLDGRYIVFETESDNLDWAGSPPDPLVRTRIFIHDLQTGETSLVSVSSDEELPDGSSHNAAVSEHGRYVAFHSHATNLVPDDTNHVCDVFVRDRFLGVTERINIPAAGGQANRLSDSPSISADGRFVAFYSLATNMVPDDNNNKSDVFVRDRLLRQTYRVSVSSGGDEGNGSSGHDGALQISANGNCVAFQSFATNLVDNDTNTRHDIFVRDLATRKTFRVSMAYNGAEGNEDSFVPSISYHGRFVAFESDASNLVADDDNEVADVFIRDRESEETVRVSISSDGDEGNGPSRAPSLSADGGFVAFQSKADNLVSGDTNAWRDVFVHDVVNGVTVRASESTCRVQANDESHNASLSSGGEFVAFTSFADYLVPEDSNTIGDIFVHEPAPKCLCAVTDPPGSGLVTRFPIDMCQPVGTIVELTAVAEGLCAFAGWSGGVPPGQEFQNPVQIPLDESMIVTAHFESSWGGLYADCDDNGIPDGCDGFDCNFSGVLDLCDVLEGTSPDCNENLRPDECDSIEPGDFNDDGQVDLTDVRGLAPCMFGPFLPPYPPLPVCTGPCLDGFDFDADGDVDLEDVSGLWSAFGGPQP